MSSILTLLPRTMSLVYEPKVRLLKDEMFAIHGIKHGLISNKRNLDKEKKRHDFIIQNEEFINQQINDAAFETGISHEYEEIQKIEMRIYVVFDGYFRQFYNEKGVFIVSGIQLIIFNFYDNRQEQIDEYLEGRLYQAQQKRLQLCKAYNNVLNRLLYLTH